MDPIPADVKRLCIFAHHDLDEHNTGLHLQNLANHFDLVVCLSDTTIALKIPKVKHMQVLNWGVTSIEMYLNALKHISISSALFDTIALADDSCLLLNPLDPLFKKAAAESYNFWGVCDSRQISHHLQCFFVVFEKKTLETLKVYIDELKVIDKEAVDGFELGISKHMTDAGFVPSAVYKWEDISTFTTSISKTPLQPNPSFSYWDRLVHLGCPLVKRKKQAFGGPKILLYVVSHSDSSFAKAQEYVEELAESQKSIVARAVKVRDDSPFFESQIFDHIDEENEYANYDWIGVITYSFPSKFGTAHAPNIELEVRRGVVAEADVVSLFNLRFYKPRVERIVSFPESVAMQHGPFLWMCIYLIFKILGFNEEAILDKTIEGFFSNWWLAKSNVMRDYVKFFKQTKKLVLTHPQISKYIKEDSYYKGHGNKKTVPDEKLIATFGEAKYQLHPFLFERLPSFYLNLKKYKCFAGGKTYVMQLGD